MSNKCVYIELKCLYISVLNINPWVFLISASQLLIIFSQRADKWQPSLAEVRVVCALWSIKFQTNGKCNERWIRKMFGNMIGVFEINKGNAGSQT